LIAVPVTAQPLIGRQGLPKPHMKLIGFLGRGIAITPDEPLNFKLVKAGVGTVKVVWAGETTELTVGILILDDTKYKLKNIEIENESVTGDVYLNDTNVGTFDVSSVTKGDTKVWFGTLEIDEDLYYIYVVEAYRPMKPAEIREKISEYCKENPGETNCREKIEEYCKDNPEDRRCVAIIGRYCSVHLKDTRCRAALKKYCEIYPASGVCKVRRFKVADFCEKYPGKCVAIKNIARTVARRVRARIGNVTENRTIA
jgi:hypothetical protein